MSETDDPLPPGAVIVSHRVADFDTWKAAFDSQEFSRLAAGILGHHINRAESDPNLITIYLPVSSVERAQEFIDSDELEQLMEKAGVVSAPEFLWTVPLRQAFIWDRELPAILISHTVDDMDSWLAKYNSVDELRLTMGIIGHALNRSAEEPLLAITYHQAESFETLREYVGDFSLRAVMKSAGVTSEPQHSFSIGGWGRLY